MPEIDADAAERKVPQREIGIQFDGAVRLPEGLPVPAGQHAYKEQCTVRVRNQSRTDTP